MIETLVSQASSGSSLFSGFFSSFSPSLTKRKN